MHSIHVSHGKAAAGNRTSIAKRCLPNEMAKKTLSNNRLLSLRGYEQFTSEVHVCGQNLHGPSVVSAVGCADAWVLGDSEDTTGQTFRRPSRRHNPHSLPSRAQIRNWGGSTNAVPIQTATPKAGDVPQPRNVLLAGRGLGGTARAQVSDCRHPRLEVL